MSGHGTRQMASSETDRTVACPVLPRCIYAAPKDRLAGPSEWPRDLPHSFPRGLGDAANHRGRPQASGRCDWFSGRASHLGTEPSSEPSLMMPVITISFVINK